MTPRARAPARLMGASLGASRTVSPGPAFDGPASLFPVRCCPKKDSCNVRGGPFIIPRDVLASAALRAHGVVLGEHRQTMRAQCWRACVSSGWWRHRAASFDHHRLQSHLQRVQSIAMAMLAVPMRNRGQTVDLCHLI